MEKSGLFSYNQRKREKLFECIVNECKCQIYLLYKCDGKATYESNDEIKDSTYFIKSDLIYDNVEYQKDEDGMCLWPFDYPIYFIPAVSSSGSFSYYN